MYLHSGKNEYSERMDMSVWKKKYVVRVFVALFAVATVAFSMVVDNPIFIQNQQPAAVYEYGGKGSGLSLKAPDTPYTRSEEAVIIPHEEEGVPDEVLPVEKMLFEYIEVVDGCDIHYEGECLLARSGPGTDFPVVARLRNHMVFKIMGSVERDNHIWYKVFFDEWIRYPERVKGDWYVAGDYVKVVLDEGILTSDDASEKRGANNKRIVVNRTSQTLTAYEGDVTYMETLISTGLELTPTPSGTFTIFRKTPTRYMQGPIPGVAEQYYDMPGVPWNLYFTHGGAVIHGAYWHDSFGSRYSHGCVNLLPEDAHLLYIWADLGTEVIVMD
jgi:hypothetical protein